MGVHNHSLRATGISHLYNSGVPEKLIMERSGHLSVTGGRSYERTSNLQRQQVSEVIAKPTASASGTTFVSEQNKTVVAHSQQANKENIFDINNLHGCTININFNNTK